MTLNQGNLLYRVAVKGTNATVVGTTALQGDNVGQGGIAWILGGLGNRWPRVPVRSSYRRLALSRRWRVPASNAATRKAENPVSDINVSEAPSERLQGTIEAPSEK
jgi:hypothetical protein